jgi:hypothetical protein
VHRRILSLALTGFICITVFNLGCTKLDTTNLGGDLIPEVDNINTFADTLYVNAVQGDYNDTTYVGSSDLHALGNITSDPLFGKTTANIFFQLKPILYPFTFGNKDSLAGLGLDSMVLCLKYSSFWGDSTILQRLQVYEVTDGDFVDSVGKRWDVNSEPTIGNALSQPKDVDVRRLADYMKYANSGDTVNNQIRIKITDPTFINNLWTSDSASSGAGNHAFHSDSLYRRAFKGMAVKAIGNGNGLMYINIADTGTKLEIHYRIRGPLNKIDTMYKSFRLMTSVPDTVTQLSASANSVKRERSGPSVSPAPTDIYLQAQAGTFATLTVPRLNTYKDTNRIIHRAELIVEQVPDNQVYDTMFSAPNFMYLDLKEPGTASPAKYKPVYLDLNPTQAYDPDFTNGFPFYPSGGPDFSYYGGFVRRKVVGTTASDYYNINITRYIQRMVTKHDTNYQMRLFPAFSFHYPQYSSVYVPYNNNVAYGRVKVGNGNHPTYPMRIRIVYSKIK